ncbi:MAG: cysteine synthase A [Deltaproteobacteria bacterium]|nr:cysteine synthase A [Deltaproteobacteria bacterium]
MIYKTLIQLIGNTPLLRLNKLCKNDEIFVKLECFNPWFSIKDRAALLMIEDLEKKGIIGKGDVIVEATSGNTGIAVAGICSVKGYKAKIIMPEGMSAERIKLLNLLGAEVVLVKGMGEAIKEAEKLGNKSHHFFLRQFENEANALAQEKTGEEIWRDMNGDIDMVVCGIGTGGTITGVGRYLKNKDRNIKVIGVEPSSSPFLSRGIKGEHRIQGIGAGFLPPILDESVIDEIVAVSDEDAFDTMERLAKEEGILAGISSGAAMWAALNVEQRGKRIVVIFPDSAERYLSVI